MGSALKQEGATPHNIVVRKIPFDFSEKIDPVWHPTKPEWSHQLNGASVTMPHLEPFLIRTIREAMTQIEDAGLKEDMRHFMAQEGQHYQNHERYNDILKTSGYPGLAQIEDEMAADYERFKAKSLKWRLAYTAGFETMTMGVTDWLITNRRNLFAGANPSVVSFVLWHMVEETEHKTVAFDAYQALFKGAYWARIWGVVCGSWHVVKFSKKSYVHMLKQDGRWGQLAARWRTFKTSLAFVSHVVPFLIGSMIPGHHPDRVNDPDWVHQWMDAYTNLPEDQIPLLDTDHPDIPAQFTG